MDNDCVRLYQDLVSFVYTLTFDLIYICSGIQEMLRNRYLPLGCRKLCSQFDAHCKNVLSFPMDLFYLWCYMLYYLALSYLILSYICLSYRSVIYLIISINLYMAHLFSVLIMGSMPNNYGFNAQLSNKPIHIILTFHQYAYLGLI